MDEEHCKGLHQRVRTHPLRWGEGWGGLGREDPHSAPHPPPRQEDQYPRVSQQAWGCPYHRGEPHSGMNEELRGLGLPLLDSPKIDRHAGGVQDYEGEPKHLGRQA